MVNKKDFEKSDSEIETIDSIEEIQHPQEFVIGDIITLDDLKGKKLNDPWVQAMFK